MNASQIKNRAVRRMGELLKEVEPAKGGRPEKKTRAADHPSLETRKSVAQAAGELLREVAPKQGARTDKEPRAAGGPRLETRTSVAEQAIAVYAKQADDETMYRAAMMIKSRAVRRMGELLQEVEPKQGGVRRGPMGPQRPVGDTRTSVAEQAGLSERQTKQALRIAAIPEKKFERHVA